MTKNVSTTCDICGRTEDEAFTDSWSSYSQGNETIDFCVDCKVSVTEAIGVLISQQGNDNTEKKTRKAKE